MAVLSSAPGAAAGPPRQSVQPPAPAAAPPPAPAPPPPSRTFAAPTGLLFNTVRADRVADFEKVLAYLQAAMEKSADARVREQAKGWRLFKATEAGPNGTVLYVFLIDPTVTGADYGLGPILAEAYPEAQQLQEIWKLYTGSVTGGGSLLNLTPVMPPSPPPPLAEKPAPR